MFKRFPRILAIDPGTREMGVAGLDDWLLLYQGVKVIKRGRSPHETLSRGCAAVAGLVEDFRPDILVFEKTFIGRNRNVALLNVLADEIQSLGRKHRLKVLSF